MKEIVYTMYNESPYGNFGGIDFNISFNEYLSGPMSPIKKDISFLTKDIKIHKFIEPLKLEDVSVDIDRIIREWEAMGYLNGNPFSTTRGSWIDNSDYLEETVFDEFH